jgi:hypothetical protein
VLANQKRGFSGNLRKRAQTGCRQFTGQGGAARSQSTEYVESDRSSIQPRLPAKNQAGDIEAQCSNKKSDWEMNDSGMKVD